MAKQISIIECVRSEVYRLLFKVIPKEYRHTVTSVPGRPGLVKIRLGDNTPECIADGLKLVAWLKSGRANWDDLRRICHQKSGQPIQEQFNL